MHPFTRWAVRGSLAVATAAAALAPLAHARNDNAYTVRALVSDGTLADTTHDPLLVNPWGVAFNPTGFVWVADNATGASTLYDGNGAKNALEVSIPNGKPTGITFNATQDFKVTNGTLTGVSAFLFVTENGIVAGWSPTVDRLHALIGADSSAAGAIYKGVAIGSTADGNRLYAADFHNARIDVFDAAFAPVTLPAGAFTDPELPAGFAPFNIMNFGGELFVTYAKQDAEGEDDVHGHGLGIVDVYDTNGSLSRRLVTRGRLNAPWGMALAPDDFGRFSGMLLVGNFGDGTINAYDPQSGDYRGTLRTADHRPIVIDGLWGIAFGNGIRDQPVNTLFFAAGPDDEAHGV
jgi:uncharacterized protein (TIGR03118 family)